MNKNVFYRKIPKVDILLEEERIRQLICRYSKETVMESIRKETDRLRAFIGKCEDEKEISRARRSRRPSADSQTPSDRLWRKCIPPTCGR